MTGLPEAILSNVHVRIGDTLSVPMGTVTFLCVYMGDRWCIHETEDDNLKGVYFLPHLLVQVLVEYAKKKVAEQEAEGEPDISPKTTTH